MKRFFGKLTILQRILVCGVVFALPIFVLLFYMVSGFNQNIGVARLELSGCRMLAPLQTLARQVPEYLFLARIHSHEDAGVREKGDRLAQEIEKNFALLQKEGKTLEEPLQVSQKSLKEAGLEQAAIQSIYGAWQYLKGGFKDSSDIWDVDVHDRVINPIHTLIKRVGNTSKLSLDSDIETHYLIEASILTLEKNQQKLGGFLLFVESVIYKGMLNKQDVAAFVTFTGTLKDDVAHIQESLDTALQENKRLRGKTTLQENIPPLFDAYQSSVTPLLFLLSRFANDPDFKIKASEFAKPVEEMFAEGTKLRQASMVEVQSLLNRRIEEYSEKKSIALFLSLGTLFLASVFAFFVSRGITHSLGGVIDVAGEIARGDLQKAREEMKVMGWSAEPKKAQTSRLPKKSKNEIKRLFMATALMISNLHSLLAQVGKSSIQVTSSSSEIAASAREIEATVAEQASSIAQVNATCKEISDASQAFTVTMDEVAEMAGTAAALASGSMESLGRINMTMKALLESTTESSGKLKTVVERMQNITQIITTITKVANQINLLSLNAAIEAEKAGEYGIGFSVVAREIRRLADQTAVSALDIEGMIKETQDAVREGVDAVVAFTEQTRTSSERIAEISVDFTQAIEHTQGLVPQFQEVNRGMQRQSQNASQISEAMAQLKEAANQTKDSLMEFRRATEQLNEAVSELQGEVSRFKIARISEPVTSPG
ncbi:MAG: methyl-accepting chemotaxis protein [Desulfobacteraceae bacterium]|nr:MAG: methyl-accepting chemotaxis protein [Desulfobacteraceae bacterium]